MKKLVWVNVIVQLILILFAQTAFAQSSSPTPSDDEVNEIASQLYCPICENTRLDVCTTEVCKAWREEIRQQLTNGKSEDQILTYFENQFGARVLADPSRARWLFNACPFLIFLSGLVVIIRVYRTRKVNLPLPEPHDSFDDNIKGGNQL